MMEIVAAGGDSLNLCCRLSILGNAKEKYPLAFLGNNLVLAYDNPEACFVHISDNFRRYSIFFYHGFQVGVKFSHSIYIFRRLPIQIQLVLKHLWYPRRWIKRVIHSFPTTSSKADSNPAALS